MRVVVCVFLGTARLNHFPNHRNENKMTHKPKTPIRIGVWFDARHLAYGGPTAVLLGTILGFHQHAAETGRPVIILLNERGDLNWVMDRTEDLAHTLQQVPDAVVGPLVFSKEDAELDKPDDHAAWTHGRRLIVASDWFRWWICRGLPFDTPDRNPDRKTLRVWEAGVDTDRFRPHKLQLTHPIETSKSQDYFIYFKSQNYEQLAAVQSYLFHHYFGFRGTVLTYYNYDADMLREAAASSRFCIVIDNPETQGLAFLEIMSCDCPLFVLDATHYQGTKLAMGGATSVTCWDPTRCGKKSSREKLEADFPAFLAALPTYRPREFVVERHSYKASANTLRGLLEM